MLILRQNWRKSWKEKTHLFALLFSFQNKILLLFSKLCHYCLFFSNSTHIGETSWGGLLLIFPLLTFFFSGIFYSLLWREITFHKFHVSLSCITHAYKMKICVFKWERGKDTQRTCAVTQPYSSLIASEVTSSLWFYFNPCLHEDRAFSFLFCSVLGAMHKCHLTKAKEKEK